MQEPMYREKCYRCHRPQVACMCGHINSIATKTKFVILMHTKEFKKVKNGTGIFSYLSLENSELFVGIDFSETKRIQEIIADTNNDCYLLFPSKKSQPLNNTSIHKAGKNSVIFIIDSTWACAKTIIRLNENISNLPHISFYHDKRSAFGFKEQPSEICLSTMESIHTVLELLVAQEEEQISEKKMGEFLNPFRQMVAYQMHYTKDIYGD